AGSRTARAAPARRRASWLPVPVRQVSDPTARIRRAARSRARRAFTRRRLRLAADVDAGLLRVALLLGELVDDLLVVAAALRRDALAAVDAELDLEVTGRDVLERVDPRPAAAAELDAHIGAGNARRAGRERDRAREQRGTEPAAVGATMKPDTHGLLERAVEVALGQQAGAQRAEIRLLEVARVRRVRDAEGAGLRAMQRTQERFECRRRVRRIELLELLAWHELWGDPGQEMHGAAADLAQELVLAQVPQSLHVGLDGLGSLVDDHAALGGLHPRRDDLGLAVALLHPDVEQDRREPADAAGLPGAQRCEQVDDLGGRDADPLRPHPADVDVRRMPREHMVG